MKKKNFEYEVALSFAGEQRDYVEKVSKELSLLNIKHFYDYNEQVNLWGKNLTQYLDSVYFEKAMYFVPFISKEYEKKVWTRLEVNSALERNMNESRPDFQQYILPVRFDDTRIPGIVGSIGHIDARKTTPQEIAHMIFEKVNKGKKTLENNKTEEMVELLSINFNHKINEDKRRIMEKIFSSQTTSHVIVVYGEKGLGKRSCVQQFLHEKKKVIKISPNVENRFQLEAVMSSLGIDTNYLKQNSDLSFEDQIKKEFFSICKKEPLIIYVERFFNMDSQTIKFLLETTEVLLNRFLHCQTFMIFELDIEENTNTLIPFYKFPPNHTDFICFNRLSTNDLRYYFFDTLGDIVISDENLTYILDSSFGNIMYLNIAINYLKGEHYIRFENGKYICDKLPSGILTDVLKEFILQRYDRLDNTLKEVLSKSSIIGNVFNTELLSKPFQIINADDMLQKIEKISQLIVHPDDRSYSFENNDVYQLIKNSISPELQKEWHEVLANYYKKLLKREQRRKGLQTVEHEIAALYPIAKHYMYAHNYDAAISYYIELIAKYEQISDYIHALAAINNIKNMLEYVDWERLHSDSLEYDILKVEADCYRNIGDFLKAYQIYEECLSYFDIDKLTDTLVEILYQKSYCLYMNGKVEEALTILNYLKEHFEKNKIYNHWYIKILSLLASTCDSTGDIKSQEKYYTTALDFYKNNQLEQEYYILLRMASMVFGEEIAINMEKTAEVFFRKQKFTRYLAEVLHNIGTDYLYIDKLADVSEPINESIELFDSFGSIAVHYPLNTKGILKMVLDNDFVSAITIFKQALQYETEAYSEIAIRTNLLNCMNVLKKPDEALQQLNQIDKLIKSEESQHVPVYEIYHNLNWAFYYFHIKDYEECLQRLKTCSNLEYMEPRFRYIYKALTYKAKKMLGLKTRNMAGTAPKKVHKRCIENGFYFTTLRFYESV